MALGDPPAPQAEVEDAESPNMFRNDWFPLTNSFGTRVVEDCGNSGNAVFDNGDKEVILLLPELSGPLDTEVGLGELDPAEVPDQGVVRGVCRKAGGLGCETGDATFCRGGYWSGGF